MKASLISFGSRTLGHVTNLSIFIGNMWFFASLLLFGLLIVNSWILFALGNASSVGWTLKLSFLPLTKYVSPFSERKIRIRQYKSGSLFVSFSPHVFVSQRNDQLHPRGLSFVLVTFVTIPHFYKGNGSAQWFLGPYWAETHYTWLVDGCLDYMSHRQIIIDACSPRQTIPKITAPKACSHYS